MKRSVTFMLIMKIMKRLIEKIAITTQVMDFVSIVYSYFNSLEKVMETNRI